MIAVKALDIKDVRIYTIFGFTPDDIDKIMSGHYAKFKSTDGNYIFFYGETNEKVTEKIKNNFPESNYHE